MTRENESRPYSDGDNKPRWVHTNAAELDGLGWRLEKPQDALLANYAYFVDTATPALLDRWRESGTNVQMNIVTIVTNKDLLRMPTTSLGYITSALRLTGDLKTSGVAVNEIRLMVPCHLGVYYSGGNVSQQLRNAEALRSLTEGYKAEYYPELDDTDVILDVGREIDEIAEHALERKIADLQDMQPEALSILLKEYGEIMKRNRTGILWGRIPEEYRPIVYLLGHPEAWGYGGDGILYDLPGGARVNYMACSELRSLIGMSQIRSAWQKNDTDVATVVSKKYVTAPYHQQAGESRLGKLLEMLQVPATRTPEAWGSVDSGVFSGNEDALRELLKRASLMSQGKA